MFWVEAGPCSDGDTGWTTAEKLGMHFRQRQENLASSATASPAHSSAGFHLITLGWIFVRRQIGHDSKTEHISRNSAEVKNAWSFNYGLLKSV
jgi:hypothetical protein